MADNLQQQTTLPPSEKQLPLKRSISRRSFVVGLTGLALIEAVAGSGITWASLLQSLQSFSLVLLGTTLLTYRGHSSGVHTVAWSPDGKHIASGSDDGTVQVWDATSGANLLTLSNSSGVHTVAWSPDGKRLASGSWDKTVQVWDATSGRNVFTYRGHSDVVDTVAWSPDGKRLASGGWDKTVQVWDATSGRNVFIYRGHSNSVDTVAWSSDGKRLASGSADGTVQVWKAS